MAKAFNYFDFITSTHELYSRYQDDWKLAIKSYYGGVEYRNGNYLKAYDIDYSTPSDVINTYDVDINGIQTAVYKSTIQPVNSREDADSGTQYNSNFYQEKINNVGVLPYTRLYVSEYNAILFRTPPVRRLPDISEVESFVQDVSGEGESINEFMSKVDTYTTIYGIVWISCVKPTGAQYPRWRMHSPLDVTNWQYGYKANGDLELKKIVIRTTTEPDVEIFQYYTPESIETVFVPHDKDVELELPEGAEYLESDDGKGLYRIVQINELGYIPVTPIYQSTKIYNGIGHTPIFDIAQLQRSVYGYSGEIYSAISYGSHPITLVDETTLAQNGNNIGAEPGSVINVQNSLNGQPNYVFEFVAPPLDSIKELRDLIDQTIDKMNQVAMVRSEELIKSSRSGAHLEAYDSKLEAFVRKKATSLENAEAHNLWPIWFDWMNIPSPKDLTVSYNRLYSQKGVENEINELNKMLEVYVKYNEVFGAETVVTDEYATQAEAENRARELGGVGFHSHVSEEGIEVFMPFTTHEEYEMRLKMLGLTSNDLREDLKEIIKDRMYQLLESSFSENSL